MGNTFVPGLRFMSNKRLCESAGYVERNHEWATSGRESLERASITEEEMVALRLYRRLRFLIISSRAFHFIFIPLYILINVVRSVLLIFLDWVGSRERETCNWICFINRWNELGMNLVSMWKYTLEKLICVIKKSKKVDGKFYFYNWKIVLEEKWQNNTFE